MPIRVDVATPSRRWIGKDADMVVVPSIDGDLAAMPDHAPAMVVLRGGLVTLFEGDRETDRLYVSGGFAEITGTRCAVMADEALAPNDIDRADAERRLGEARGALDGTDPNDLDAVPAAFERLQVAQSRVDAAGAAGQAGS